MASLLSTLWAPFTACDVTRSPTCAERTERVTCQCPLGQLEGETFADLARAFAFAKVPHVRLCVTGVEGLDRVLDYEVECAGLRWSGTGDLSPRVDVIVPLFREGEVGKEDDGGSTDIKITVTLAAPAMLFDVVWGGGCDIAAGGDARQTLDQYTAILQSCVPEQPVEMALPLERQPGKSRGSEGKSPSLRVHVSRCLPGIQPVDPQETDGSASRRAPVYKYVPVDLLDEVEVALAAVFSRRPLLLSHYIKDITRISSGRYVVERGSNTTDMVQIKLVNCVVGQVNPVLPSTSREHVIQKQWRHMAMLVQQIKDSAITQTKRLMVVTDHYSQPLEDWILHEPHNIEYHTDFHMAKQHRPPQKPAKTQQPKPRGPHNYHKLANSEHARRLLAMEQALLAAGHQ
ncbi:unnamed protein product [Vitrella brassicaformis CCMP3155]|uniref:Uncharacterized protein n=2 Tax=Vitrella brassicaformis TaxID=1169539 RepID=A0A0G4EJG6_VITBC|nr:unnamed protein product [Vitrella brassicaformis CCMP3155]|eukprot:CEL96664.1 unnamed protein product [Vitrella brassicaformis CCMP3155]